MISTVKKKQQIIITICLLSFYILCLAILEGQRTNQKSNSKNGGLWDLPPNILSAVAGEFKGITSSYMLLEAGARTGTNVERTLDGRNIVIKQKQDCKLLYKILKASQHLDPAFQQTFMLSQAWLPWKCEMVEETMAILQVAKDTRSWDYFPFQFMAFNTYYFLNDYKKAGKILLNAAATVQNAPSFLGILGSRLSQKGGDTQAAVALLETILLRKNPEDPGYEDLHKRLLALRSVLIVEKTVSKYKVLFTSFPETTDQLIEKGLLTDLPINPYNLSFCINQEGHVFFDRPDCRNNQ